MAKNEPAAGDKPDETVQPANKPADAPSTDQPKDQPKDEPKTTGKADTPAEQPAGSDLAPDLDEAEEGAEDQPAGAGEGDRGEGADEDEGQDEDLKPESKHYYERQLKKKDETIEKLTGALEEHYVGQGADENEQRIRRVEADNYVRDVQAAQNDLVVDNQRAQSEIAMFNPSSKKFREDLYTTLKRRYARDYVIVQDIKTADGQVEPVIIGYRVPFYDYMKEEADLISGVAEDTAKGAAADRQMRGAADTPGSSRNRSESTKDPFLVGLTEGAPQTS